MGERLDRAPGAGGAYLSESSSPVGCDLGIVMVSFNTRELLRACLESVFAALATHTLLARVCLVDNASSDGSAEMVRASYPQVELLASADNLGYAAGNNRALQHLASTGHVPRYVLLLNPDTVVAPPRPAAPDALTELVSFLDAHPSVGIAGAQLRYGDGRFQHGAFRFPTLPMLLLDFWPLNHRLLDARINGRYPRRRYAAGKPFPIDHPLGAALIMRWRTYQQVGGLDEGYFMYCEEIDLCMRAKAAGWQIYCVPRAIITHHEGQSAKQFRERMFVALWRSRYRLFARHYGRTYQRVARMIIRAGVARDMRRLQRALARNEVAQDDAAARLAAYREVLVM